MSVHRVLLGFVQPQSYAIVNDGQIVAIATHPDVARRIDELLDRNGLADVPDTIEGIT